jgi:hypothetical protein
MIKFKSENEWGEGGRDGEGGERRRSERYIVINGSADFRFVFLFLRDKNGAEMQ